MASPIRFLKLRIRSFGYAFKGIGTLFATQANAQVHFVATLLIVGLGFWLELSPVEWCLILICIALVLTAEGVNTAIEFVVDLVSPDPHPLAGKAKDVAAGAVLISVIICGCVWGIIYLPKLWDSFFSG
ncbi:MAG: diacylglycerol kinase family protein [Bacteroidota bacterium]